MFNALIKTIRPKQWAKSVFLFAALVFDRKLTNLEAIWHTLAGALVFSLIVSAVYIINDIADVESDRKHPTKRNRPIAAGKLPIPVAWGVAAGILLVAFPLTYLLSPAFALVTGGYFLLNLLYSKWLKHVALLDIIVLASFYVLRVAAGVTLIDVLRFSPWIYLFTIFLALLMGAGKRRAELAELAGSSRRVRARRITARRRSIPPSLSLSSFTRLPSRRRSVSSWVSPGPRRPIPPRWRSRWVQPRTSRVARCSSCASSTWSLPSWERARWAKMSRMRLLRSTTRAASARSRLRLCPPESS